MSELEVDTKTTSTSTINSTLLLDQSQEYMRLRNYYINAMAALNAHTINPPNSDTHISMRSFASSDLNPNCRSLAELMSSYIRTMGTETRQAYYKEERELYEWRSKVTNLCNEANRAFEQLTLFLDPSKEPLSLFPSVNNNHISKRKNPESSL